MRKLDGFVLRQPPDAAEHRAAAVEMILAKPTARRSPFAKAPVTEAFSSQLTGRSAEMLAADPAPPLC